MELLVNIISLSIPILFLAWLLPGKGQVAAIIVATAVFIGLISPVSLVILSTTSICSYFVLKRYPTSTTVVLTIIVSLASIFLFFKLEYGHHFKLLGNRILPFGLSYYSFRQIHYAIESYKKKLPKHHFIDYLSYLFFLPTFFVGPINRFQPFLKDLQKRRWNSTLFSSGLERILYGFVKISLIGNYLLSIKLDSFSNSLVHDHLWFAQYLQMFKFAANSYVQFAGYSDVAIGLSLLFGFNIIENFNYPFLAKNIADFWKRWHISLSEWCRDYIFYPFLSITRNGKVSVIITMLILGLWHEISIRYIIWGILHAIAINIWHQYEGTNFQKKLNHFPKIQAGIGIFITLNFVMLSFVIIREETLSNALETYKILFFIKN
ncbi:MBOAT family protein [Pedobacter changchengzhani]|uniref:MBOAT family protein n=1 Tax=Pedobacter changchengzhani TaxID=2529274 RepID=A0A4R5ML13_9SPHI|nr:MBOAT family O-acyltransferase [Pedobacter changchengzhani]TDG35895.1 MBOAT family protein [Pedobacter changchengzhani]